MFARLVSHPSSEQKAFFSPFFILPQSENAICCWLMCGKVGEYQMAIVLTPGCRNLVTSMLMLTGRLSLTILHGIQLAVDTLRSLMYTSTLPVVAIVAEANTGSSCNRICCLNQISEVLSTCWVAIQCV
jgi:hypothetical protein